MTRALVLGGGGIKSGYQAGCLQVLLDEARLHFDIIDAASGGCFNAAMICNGMSGTEIAEAWRSMDPFDFISLDLAQICRGPFARSINSSRGLRDRVFPHWGLDFARIRTYAGSSVRFNVFDFTNKRLEVIPHARLDADYLCASVALPMWFPAVRIGTQTLLDAVYISDANLDEVVACDPDEIWSVWTVSRSRAYRAGFLAQYFHIIEMAGDGNFFRSWDGIPEHIEKHLVHQEVPIHYIFNLSRDRMAAAVELGIADTRAYCREAKPKTFPVRLPPSPAPCGPLASLSFTETMRGELVLGRSATAAERRIVLTLTIDIADVASFVRDPSHEARATGQVRVEGATFECSGTLRLLVDRRIGTTIEPGHKRFVYDLAFRDPTGAIRTFYGVKFCDDDSPRGLWHDTTTAYFRLGPAGGQAGPARAAILRIGTLDFVCEVLSMRGRGVGGFGPAAALVRFLRFFAAGLFDTYCRRIIDYGPF